MGGRHTGKAQTLYQTSHETEGDEVGCSNDLVEALSSPQKAVQVKWIRLNSFDLTKTDHIVFKRLVQLLRRTYGVVELSLSECQFPKQSLKVPRSLQRLRVTHDCLMKLPVKIKLAAELRHIDLSWNAFTALPKALQSVPQLESLNFSNNKISIIDGKLIKHFPRLKAVYLSHNLLTTICSDILQLQDLETADFSHNQIREFHLPPLSETRPALKILFLNNNPLQALPPEIGFFPRLSTLNITETRVTELPTELIRLEDLTELEVTAETLVSPPPHIAAHSTSEILNYLGLKAQSDKIFKVQAWTDVVTLLQPNAQETTVGEVRLTGINFTDLDDGPTRYELHKLLDTYSEIERVSITNSSLQAVPFVLPFKLIELNVSNSDISEIGSNLKFLPKLRVLDLSCNNIKALGGRLQSNSSLVTLNLANNLLSELQTDELRTLPDLKRLNLSQNQIVDFRFSLASAPSLETLNLSFNKLRVLPPSFFETESPLRTFLISDNELHTLPKEMVKLASLKIFEAHNNLMQTFPEVMSKLPQLELVNLTGNLFEGCDAITTVHQLVNVEVTSNETACNSEPNRNTASVKQDTDRISTVLINSAEELNSARGVFGKERKKTTRLGQLMRNGSLRSGNLLLMQGYDKTRALLNSIDLSYQSSIRYLLLSTLFCEESCPFKIERALLALVQICDQLYTMKSQALKPMVISGSSMHYFGRVLNYGGSCAFLCGFGFESLDTKNSYPSLELRFSPIRDHYKHPAVVKHRAGRTMEELQQLINCFSDEAARIAMVPDYEV